MIYNNDKDPNVTIWEESQPYLEEAERRRQLSQIHDDYLLEELRRRGYVTNYVYSPDDVGYALMDYNDNNGTNEALNDEEIQAALQIRNDFIVQEINELIEYNVSEIIKNRKNQKS